MFDDFQHLAAEHTCIFYDLRNRGRSDEVTDGALLEGGVHNDVQDLEAVRRHFQLEKVSVLGHSYVGTVVALYAMLHPNQVSRVVQIGPSAANTAKQYPPELTNMDATARRAAPDYRRCGPCSLDRGAGVGVWLNKGVSTGLVARIR